MAVPLYYYFAGYVSASIILFLFPTLIHRKAKTPKIFDEAVKGEKIYRVAHRGGPRLTTQNTIQAFRKVVHVSDMLEMDVCETKDNVLVVHHDQSLQRTCGVIAKVNQYDYKDLPHFGDQITLDFADNMTITTNNEKIPTLEEVFKIFQGVPMNIQLKTPTKTAIFQFARLLEEYDRKQTTVVGIRNSNMQIFQAIAPDTPKFMNDKSVFKMLLLYYTGLLPFFPLKYQTFQFPIATHQFEQRKIQQFSEKRPLQIWKIRPIFNILKFMNWTWKPLIYHLKQRGIAPIAWVCNEEKDIEKAISLGAVGIMTDTPFELDNYLKKKYEKKEQ